MTAALSSGERLGPYEIIKELGAGGMGTVYKARDTRLDRVVAIKFAQAEFTERFAREARSIAALNHPNICQIYDVGPNYLVMEYVEGSPLAPPDNPKKLLDLAIQVADGMAAAHKAGIVHRDLKPDNILVTTDGRVKILDFGLAKAIAPEKLSDATGTMELTDAGTVIGTVTYMSPEQAKGEQNLGAQSDQFAFGLILYEMAAGRRAFIRDSRVETMTAIIREEADPLPPSVPAPLKWIITRLMAKDPADRYDSSRDLYRELKQIRERLSEVTTGASQKVEAVTVTSAIAAAAATVAVPAPVPEPQKPRSSRSWIMLAAGLLVGGAAMWMLSPSPRAQSSDLAAYRFTPLSRDAVTESTPAWAPDGKSIAYAARLRGTEQVFTRAVGSSEAAPITRGEQSAYGPFWSPDGATIYFRMNDGIWATGATGGTPERIFEGATGGAVHRDGKTFAFIRAGKIWTSVRGGEAREVALPKEALEGGDGNPNMVGFSPDGTKLAITYRGDMWVWSFPPAGDAKKAGSGVTVGGWMPDSRRLVMMGRSDLEGTLLMVDTADGSKRTIYSSPDTIMFPAVSPDGKRVAFTNGRSEWNLMEVAVPTGRVRTMLVSGGVSFWPAWAPSGSHYLYATNRTGKWAVEDAPAASDGFPRRLIEGESISTYTQLRWAPDGTRFTLSRNAVGKPPQVVLANASGGTSAPLEPAAPGITYNAIWSVDSQWILYVRTVAGEIQVARIRPGSTAGPEILAAYKADRSTDTFRQPVQWSPKGDGILAYGRDALYMMSLDYKTERKIASGMFDGPVGFSKDGGQVYALFPNTAADSTAAFSLMSYDVATGAAKRLADVDLPVTTSGVRGFSMHPDGTRFATSIAKWPFDIWMLEGFE
jgi:Tol biopolymer transport system component/predicted Ser/Thr protein kinase